MKLGERLTAVANFVKFGARVADIGTDHAKLPIFLTETNKISFAIASDKNKGPLSFAKKNILAAGLKNNIEVRLGDGLSSVKAGEVDTIIIAGMGGVLITEILKKSPKVLSEVNHLILQPMNEGFFLRDWLLKNNWKIENEILIKEDNKIYEIISVVKGQMRELSETELFFGPIILNSKSEILKEKINEEIIREKRKLNGMEKSESAVNSEEYILKKKRLKTLEELLW